MKDRTGERKKIMFYGLFGQGNLGNDCTLKAILDELPRHFPHAEVSCICSGPEQITAAHTIAAVSMRDDILVKTKRRHRNALGKALRRVFMRIPAECYQSLKAFRTLGGTDLFIVPGTQLLSDNLSGGPWGWPYLTLRWAIAAKLRRCKLIFVSVGVGPLRHPLSRVFVKAALSLADYRSYRDNLSREYTRSIGLDSTHDPIYPDLAFSLSMPAVPNERLRMRTKAVVAVGVKGYRSQYGPRPVEDHHADEIYRNYIEQTAIFVCWLLGQRYTVRLVVGDTAYDPQVLVDLRQAVKRRDAADKHLEVIEEPIKSLEQLTAQLAASDIVVSPRYHNVLLGLLLNKPVIALSYHDKFLSLLDGFGLKGYCHSLETFDVDRLIAQFVQLDREAENLLPRIRHKTDEYRKALEQQYSRVFK